MDKEYVNEFLDFVGRAPTAFHACAVLSNMLLEAGFEELSEGDAWALLPGKKYYFTRNGSSLIAFAIPDDGGEHFQVVAAHGDSPMLKLKPAVEHATGPYLLLNTEVYGGAILSTWFDRPLSIAGRLVVRDGNALQTRLIDLERDLLVIPNMPIHFNRKVNDGVAIDKQVDLRPLLGDTEDAGWLMNAVAEKAGISQDSIMASELFVYDHMRGCLFGTRDQFFSAPRIDDLECAWTAIRALIAAAPIGHINVCAVYDNEEVGSETRQGADASFLRDTLIRIRLALGATYEEALCSLNRGMLLSADNAHAVHPNHMEKYDEDHRVKMNGGVVLKYNADQRYTTDAETDAVFSAICKAAGVPVQRFVNRSDIRGGSTVGPVSSATSSLRTADIGLAQLAMHSCYETAGSKDLEYMVQALTRYYDTDIINKEDGSTLLI